jgi:hypothetical protein
LQVIVSIAFIGAQYWIRTSDPRRVKAVLYR